MAHRAFRIFSLLTVLVVFAPACEWDYPIWIPRSSDADAIYRFRKGDHFGYIDGKGKVIIAPTIRAFLGNYGGEFHDGRAQIDTDGIYVDANGKRIANPNLEAAWDYSEGLAAAAPKGQRLWGYIDTHGDFAISPRFESGPNDHVWSFSDGLAKVEVNKRYGFIDHSGSFVIPPKLLYAESFHDGFAEVVVDGPCVYMPEGACATPQIVGLPSQLRSDTVAKPRNCKVTFMDKQGRIISDKGFDYAMQFQEDFAPVLVDKKWGYIDRTGELVIGPRFDGAIPFSDGLARVNEKGLYGFIDKHGAYVIRPQFKYAEDFSDGYAVVGEDAYTGGPLWYIDHDGTPLFKRKFAAASSFFKGVAHVKLLSKRGDHGQEQFEYLNREGKTIFAYTP